MVPQGRLQMTSSKPTTWLSLQSETLFSANCLWLRSGRPQVSIIVPRITQQLSTPFNHVSVVVIVSSRSPVQYYTYEELSLLYTRSRLPDFALLTSTRLDNEDAPSSRQKYSQADLRWHSVFDLKAYNNHSSEYLAY